MNVLFAVKQKLMSSSKRLLLGSAVSILALAGLFTPATSLASAYGCAFGNQVTGPAWYCVTLSGSGTYVNYVSGSFRGSAVVGNAYITAEFFDNNWRWYQTINSRTIYGWMTGADLSIPVYAYKQSGYMCSTLHYIDPNYAGHTMSVCHQIHP